MRRLFISGTNTGVGKTLASALLCRELSKKGSVGYVKPVQTGCFEKDGELQAPDVEFVKQICGNSVETFCPVKFKLPASPHLSAAQENTRVDCQKLIQEINEFSEEKAFDFLVIEGAGGITVPITLEYNMMDLCKDLDCELIIVTTTLLGTLNHTKLTLDFAESHGFEASIIISGCSEDPDIIESDNIKLISEMVEGSVIFHIPNIEGLDTESDAKVDLPEIQLNKLS